MRLQGTESKVRAQLARDGLGSEEIDKQVDLLDQAIKLTIKDRSLPFDIDAGVMSRFTSSVVSGGSYRLHHGIALEEVRADLREVAFGMPTDRFREENAAFCHLMFQGLQKRFLDRYAGETPEDFLDRPRKTTRNVTRLVINVLSKLYHLRPVREFEENTDEEIQEALKLVWTKDFDRKMLEVDRYTRLQGTVAVRPFYDEEIKGKIRLWPFRSDQLRVIPDAEKPWKASVVIERDHPFWGGTQTRIWTDKVYLVLRPDRKIDVDTHGLGQVPHTFFRDGFGWGSFFVEGRGRSLCDANAIINGKITDLNEIFQVQGFGVPFVKGESREDQPTISPRTPIHFKDAEPHHGLFYAKPEGAIQSLRAEIIADVSDLFREQQIPEAALGAALGAVPPSGVSIREAMRPLLDDLEERALLFSPLELVLADNCLRMRAEHDEGFDYDPKTQRPEFSVLYQRVRFATDIRDQTVRDDFEVAQGINTASKILRRTHPEQYKTDDEALDAVRANVAETRSLGGPMQEMAEDVNDAEFGDAFPDSRLSEGQSIYAFLVDQMLEDTAKEN